jgi:integrase/recombinase XerC
VAAGTISDDVIRCYRRDCRSLVKYAAKRFGRALVRDLEVNDLVVWMATPKADGSAVTTNTRRGRLSAAKAFFKTCTCLGIYDLNPAESIAETERQARYVCRLTDDQMDQLCGCAPFTLTETKTPAALALMMLGAGSREAAYVRVCDIDFANDRVWVHDGGERFAPRWLPIDDDWARQALKARVKALAQKHADPVALATATVAYERGRKRGADTPLNRQSAISRTLSALMTKARVYRAGQNRVESIREWVAFRVFTQTQSIEAVAQRLGMASLDAAAHIVGYDWVAAHRIDVAAPVEPGATL